MPTEKVALRRLTMVLVGLLTLVAGATITSTIAVLAATPSAPAPPTKNLLLGPPRVVQLQGLAASPVNKHPNVSSPFLPKNQASYSTAKQLANHGQIGQRAGVVALPHSRAQVGTSIPQTAQQLAAFPVMDLSRQVSLYPTDQSISPPDTQLAAGPTYLAEADNSTLSIWTKSGSLVQSADLNVFFFEPTGYQFSDPRILYDTESGRWFLSGLAFNSTNDSQTYIAVSTTSDPTGAWNVYLLVNATGVIGDQPMIGVNSDKVVISWNNFSGLSPATATFSGQETRVLQKSDLVSGVSVHTSAFAPDTRRYRIVPAQSLTPTTTEWLSYNNADCTLSCNTGNPTVGVVAITGTPLMGNVTWNETDPSIAATTVPPDPRQPSGVPVVQANDDRFISAVWQGGLLWVSGSAACLPTGDSTMRSCMKLVEISTSGNPTVAQDFAAGQAGVDLYYPAVTFDSAGDLFVAYSDSSPTIYPTASAVDSLAASPTSFENPITIASGLTSYQLGTMNRWGDYSAAAVDPANPADVWVTAEYQANALNASDWGTATARVAIQPSITSVTPNFGPIAGGLPVTIAGSRFQTGATVSFGSSAATNVSVVSSTQINATTPAGTAGVANVTVSQPDGTAVTAPGAYTYTTRPAVSSVVPNNGPLAGGTSVVITGFNFTSVNAVSFGSTAASAFTVNSTTQIAATSPAGSGTIDVTVTAAGGTSATSSADTFTYGLSAPTAVTATSGNGSATVSWMAPAFNGGSAITSYTVTGSPSGSQTLNCPCPTLLTIVGSLTNGISYTFTVHATNGVGSGPESGPSNAVTPIHRASGPVVGKPIVGDFSGDGRTDLALVDSSGISVAVSSGTAFSAPTTWAPFPFYGTKATLAGDVTGDGKGDMVAVNSSATFVLPSTGTAFGAPANWSNTAFYGTRGTFLADVNGDGKADLVAVNDTNAWVMLSTGTGFGPPTPWAGLAFYGNVTTTIGDVNGDGKADLIAINTGSAWIMTSTGTSFSAPVPWSGLPFYGTVTTTVADVNGDGKADLVAVNAGSQWVMTSTGTGFNAPAPLSGTPFYGQLATLPGDVNGDLKADLIAINNSSVWIAPSTGNALSPPENWW